MFLEPNFNTRDPRPLVPSSPPAPGAPIRPFVIIIIMSDPHHQPQSVRLQVLQKRDMTVKILKSKNRRHDVELKQKKDLTEAIGRIRDEFGERLARQRTRIRTDHERVLRISDAIAQERSMMDMLGGVIKGSAAYLPARPKGVPHLPVDLGVDGESSSDDEVGANEEGAHRPSEWDDAGRKTPDFLEARGRHGKAGVLAGIRQSEGLLDVLKREEVAHLWQVLLTRFNVGSLEAFCKLPASVIENTPMNNVGGQMRPLASNLSTCHASHAPIFPFIPLHGIHLGPQTSPSHAREKPEPCRGLSRWRRGSCWKHSWLCAARQHPARGGASLPSSPPAGTPSSLHTEKCTVRFPSRASRPSSLR